jgi:hypothetical protein
MASSNLQLPNFDKHSLEVCFTFLETQFQEFKIKEDGPKYMALMQAIMMSSLADKLSQWLPELKEGAKYDGLKKAVSEKDQITFEEWKLLIGKETIGDQRPSEFRTRLANIGNIESTYKDSEITAEEVYKRWIAEFPHYSLLIDQAYAQGGTKEAAALADKMHKHYKRFPRPADKTPQIAAARFAPDPAIKVLQDQLAVMTTQLTNLQKEVAYLKQDHKSAASGRNNNDHYRRRSTSRGSTDRRSASPVPKQSQPFYLRTLDANNECGYHKKFGGHTHSCIQGCIKLPSFRASGNQGTVFPSPTNSNDRTN